MSVHVTQHAVDRYIERIAPVDRDEARRILERADAQAIEKAAAFGAHTVRLGSGVKLVITGVRDIRVVSVLPRHCINWSDLPPAEREHRKRYAREAAEERLTLCGRAAPAARRPRAACCSLCGLRSGHPMARACTRADCELADRGEGFTLEEQAE